MVDVEHIAILGELIKEQKRPFRMETEFGKVAIVITPEAKEYWGKKGYTVITIYELGDLILDEQGNPLPKEKQEKNIKAVFETAKIFKGEIRDVRVCTSK